MSKSIIMRALMALLMLSALPAYAASFECDKAKIKVEHLICDHTALGQLDEEMRNTYRSTLEQAANPDKLIQSQRNWIKERNKCHNVACVTQSYSDRLTAIKKVKPAGWKTYTDRDLGISFKYLENLQVRKPCPQRSDERCVALVSRDMGISDYIIAFSVMTGSLEKIARKEALFELENGKWLTTAGPGIPAEVTTFYGSGWKGMRATQSCGVFDPETGRHLGECFVAVISNGKRAVVAETQGILGNDRNTELSVESIRFTK